MAAAQVITTGPDGKTYTDSSLTYVLRDGQVVYEPYGGGGGIWLLLVAVGILVVIFNRR